MTRRARSSRKTSRQRARTPTHEQFLNIVAAATRVTNLAEESLKEKPPGLGDLPPGLILLIGEFEHSMNPRCIPFGQNGRLAIGVSWWPDVFGVAAALRQLFDIRDEIIVRAGLERMCAGEAVILGSVGMRAANPGMADRIIEVDDEFRIIDRSILAKLWSAINKAHDAVKSEVKVIHQEVGLAIFHGPFGFLLRSDYEHRWDASSIKCPVCRRQFSQPCLEGTWRELPSRRKRRGYPQKDRWFPYDHERIRSLMGGSARLYKGQLTKLSKRHPRLRRRASKAECKRFGLCTAQFVYDVFLSASPS